MIYKCENCQHRENCCENKEQYTSLCKVVQSVLKLDKEPECLFGKRYIFNDGKCIGWYRPKGVRR